MFVALRAIFVRKEVPWRRNIASKIELGEVQPVEEPVCSKDVIEPTVIGSHPKSTFRRSDSVSR